MLLSWRGKWPSSTGPLPKIIVPTFRYSGAERATQPKGIGNLSSFNCLVPSRSYVGTPIAAKLRMCECCGLNAAKTSVSAMLSAGASQSTIRLAVCESCRDKAQARDQDTWRRIEAIVKERTGS